MIERRASGLFVVSSFNINRMRASGRTVTLTQGPHAGQRAKVTVDDSGTVTQIERDEGLDAVVRPASITVRIPIRRMTDVRR